MQHKRLRVRVCVCECVGHPSCPSSMALCIRMCACNFPWEIYANKITNKFYNFMCKPCRRHTQTHQSVIESFTHWVILAFSRSFIHSFVSFQLESLLCQFFALSLAVCLHCNGYIHCVHVCVCVCLYVCVWLPKVVISRSINCDSHERAWVKGIAASARILWVCLDVATLPHNGIQRIYMTTHSHYNWIE